MRIRVKILSVMTLLILLTSAVFTTILYNHKKSTLIRSIDKKLFAVAHTAKALLPADFHNRITDEKSLSKDEYLQIVDTYNRLCVTLGMEYVWSLLRVDGKTVFTTGTSTSKDITQGDHALFFQPHSNPELYDKVFKTMEVQYQVNDDKWGRINAVLVPFLDKHGRPYLFGASMKSSEVDILLKETLNKSLIISMIVLVVGFIVSLVLAHSFAKPITELANATEDIANGDLDRKVEVGGSTELTFLSKNVNLMTSAIREKIEEIKVNGERFKITLDSIGDGVIATDAEGAITRINPVAEKLTGWSFAETEGRHLEDVFNIVNADTRRKVESPVEKVIQTGEIVGLAQHTMLISKDGHERQIADSGAPIRNEDGDIIGVVLVFRDVTEQYLIEEQLRQSQKMDSIGQLAGGVAHDFNNMLAGIMGAAEILEMDLGKDGANNTHLKIILSATNRAADLTKKLLAFSRRGKIVSTSVDVHNAITEASDILKRSIDKTVELSVDLQASVPFVIGDPSQLESAFLNLGINARDAMPGGGSLRFATSNVILDDDFCERVPFDVEAGPYLEVCVSDTGKGIRKEMQERIFEPFFTTKEVGKGTGLGLAAVYGTVKDHMGLIHVYSEPGEGSVFKLYFPVNESCIDHIETISSDEIHGSGCILVVDDEPIIRSTAQQLLGSMGYDVLLAENGVEGVELYRREEKNIDLILLDMVMPKMNGEDAFFEFKKINHNVKVLISSGFSQHASMAKLLDNGALGVISKPYRRLELGQKISSILG
jgi:PAS domain S-box-containing protein